MNGKYHLIEVSPDQLHAAEWQPPDRVEASTAIAALERSIAGIGLQYPILVVPRPDGKGYSVVDGHRRRAAIINLIKQGKWRTGIPVLVATGTPSELFASVSGTTRPLSAPQWVYVHLNGGAVPSGPTKVCITQLEKTMGREFLIMLSDADMSPHIWNLSARVIKYLVLDDEERANVLNWLAGNKLSRPVSTWITQGYDKGELRDAFRQRRKPMLTSNPTALTAAA